jgi:hypothetical protein
MAGNGETKRGRRKRVSAEGQTLPAFMSASRSRVSERVVMSAATSREMSQYLRWASELARVGRDEAQVMMLDRSLGDFMKRDEAWQAEKAVRGAAEDKGDDAAGEDAKLGVTRPPGPAKPPNGAQGGVGKDEGPKPPVKEPARI